MVEGKATDARHARPGAQRRIGPGWAVAHPRWGGLARGEGILTVCSPLVEAAFFDLDKTVIAKASMVAFGRPLLREGMISRALLVRAMWSHLVFQHLGADEERMARFRSSALRLTTGWEQNRINTIVREALIEVIEPIVFDEALQLIREHQAEGRRVFLISASPEEIVAPLAQYLGVDEAIASRALLDADGRYTGEVEFYSYGPFKAEAMREAAELQDIDLDASFAYSDSITDLPMLEAVGHPVAVNPDRELGRIARARGWEVRIFRHRVPLRERVAMPRPRWTVVAALALAVASTTAAITWWSLVRGRTGPPGNADRPRPRLPGTARRVGAGAPRTPTVGGRRSARVASTGRGGSRPVGTAGRARRRTTRSPAPARRRGRSTPGSAARVRRPGASWPRRRPGRRR